MNGMMEHSERLEQELMPEPLGKPAAGSLLLHGALAGVLVLYGVIGGLFHHNIWGSPGAGGAIQVSLVSSALPLPAEKVNENVLATDTPSEAPAEVTPKAKQAVDMTAIPIIGKNEKPKPQTVPKNQVKQPAQDNRAQYGEQSGSIMPRTMQAQGGSNGPTSVGDGDFASRFGWYVDGINRKMATSWNKAEVDPLTPRGTRVFLVFSIHRGGNPTDVQVDRSSGSATLDRSCERGVQRVDTFGNLPPAYNSSTLKVSYYCEY
jgi:protein TonB